MKFIDLTFDSPQHNLACDEALLDWCESGYDQEILRFWDSSCPFVVLGYSNKTVTEVRLDRARREDVPVLRRCSGGGAVLQGPGCLNYTLILRIPDSGPLASITETNRHIIDRLKDALQPTLGNRVAMQGQTDLALGDQKFSGNAQRRKRRFLLFHGTFLLNFDIGRVERLLPMPSRQPDYRRHRGHADFLTNTCVPARAVRDALVQLWGATEPVDNVPFDAVEKLARTRYLSDDWNFKF